MLSSLGEQIVIPRAILSASGEQIVMLQQLFYYTVLFFQSVDKLNTDQHCVFVSFAAKLLTVYL